MSKELVISATSHERKSRFWKKPASRDLYRARKRIPRSVGTSTKQSHPVLPGMQSAFVDIGLDGDAFLYVSDVFGKSGKITITATVTKQRRRFTHGDGPRVPSTSSSGEMLATRTKRQSRNP